MRRSDRWDGTKAIWMMLAVTTLAACDASDSPTALDLDDPGAAAPAVVVGHVEVATSSSRAALSAASGLDLSGVLVTLEGTLSVDTTDAHGNFRIEGRSEDGKIRLRFRRGSIDARLELEGVGPGVIIRVEVKLSDDGATVSDSSRGNSADFEGPPTLVSVTGAAPNRTLRVDVTRTGGSIPVDIVEGATIFDAMGDLLTLAEVLDAFDAQRPMEIEGEGALQADGSITAAGVKVETEDDDEDDGDGDDQGEFEGAATLVSVAGAAPGRTLRVEIAAALDTVLVDILEGQTAIDDEGDILVFGEVLSTLEAGTLMRMEGEGALQNDGSITAADVKVETDADDADDADEDDEDDEDEQQFEGVATLVSITGDAPARTLRVTIVDDSTTGLVDIVEGATTFDNGGDFASFGDVLTALQAGTPLEIDGEGEAQADGSVVATSVKVETDD